jgi:hypothetical protein
VTALFFRCLGHEPTVSAIFLYFKDYVNRFRQFSSFLQKSSYPQNGGISLILHRFFGGKVGGKGGKPLFEFY